jgi:hypothetical protein
LHWWPTPVGVYGRKIGEAFFEKVS